MHPERLTALLNGLDAIAPDAALYTKITTGEAVPIGATAGDLLDLLRMPVGQLQDFIRQRQKPSTDPKKLLEWSDAIADCTCWFKGFMAGHGESADGTMPPGWRTLIEINIAIKRRLSDTSDGAGAETDLPF